MLGTAEEEAERNTAEGGGGCAEWGGEAGVMGWEVDGRRLGCGLGCVLGWFREWFSDTRRV